MKILIIASHPDDEVLGCGGTIVKYAKRGDEVHLCIVTKAYTPDWSEEFLKNRLGEIDEANKILGIKKTYFLDFPTAKLDTVPQKELNQAVSKVIKEVAPHILYVSHQGDLHKDHRLVYEAALIASRPMEIPLKRILCYETLSETDEGITIKPFFPNVYHDITDTFRTKVEAMKAYKSEVRQYPHPRSLEIIEALAKKRGSEAGLKLAEAFMLMREIN
jgi:LmbE family N-acetylglucosaminyl deacetylase